MERLKAEKRRFDYRERTLMGFLGNAIGLVRPGMARTGKVFPTLFTLLVSGQTRRELMLARQALAKKALSEKQFGSRKARADKLRHIRDAQLATLSAAYDLQKAGARSAPRRKKSNSRSRNGAIFRPGATSCGTNGERNSGSGNGRAGRATAAIPATAIRAARAIRAAAATPLPRPGNGRPTILPTRIKSLAEKPKRPAGRRSGRNLRRQPRPNPIARKPDGNSARAPRNASRTAVTSRGSARGQRPKM